MRRILVTVLIFSALTAALVTFLTNAADELGGTGHRPECPVTSAGDVRRTARLVVDNTDVPAPVLTSVTVVTVPLRAPLVGGLFQGRAHPAYRQSMHCLLRTGDGEWRWWERRKSPPAVVVGNDKVMITDTVYADVDYLVWELCRSPDQSLAPGPRGFPDCEAEAGVGPWRLHGPGAGRWYFELAADPAGTWDEVTLELPPGWLRAPIPLPAASGPRHLTWRGLSQPAGFTLLPDIDARSVITMNAHPGRSLSMLLLNLCDLAILLLPVIWTGTRSRGRKRSPSSGHPDPGDEPGLRERRARDAARARRRRRWRARLRLRFLLVPLTVTLITAVIDETNEWFGPSVSEGDAEFTYWAITTGALLLSGALMLGAARLWRALPAMVLVAAMYGGVGLSERLVPAGEEHLVFPDEMPLLPWSAPLAIGASLILVLLLLIAVLNGLRLAWRPCADAALPAWAWWAATSGAALTVSYVCYASARDRSWAAWLDYDTASIAGVAWDQLWLPYSVVWLVSGSGLLWLWPLALVLAYLREQAAVRAAIGLPLWHSPGAGPPTVTGPSGRRRLMVVWVFAAGAMSFSEYYGGLYLPVKFVATAVTLWLILRVSRSRVVALHRLDDGRPLLATLEPGVFEQVRERALTFLETRRTGRMSDSGAAERPEKLKEEFEKLEQWPPGQEGKLPTGISPLHLALLAGPEPPGRGGPAGLAWRTGSITLALGVIPMLYLLWWDVQAEGGPLSLTRDAGMWYSANVIQEVVFWFLPGYLLGLLWRELPGRTGAIRSLSLSGAYAAGVVAYWVPAEIMDLADVTGMSLRALLLFVVLTTAGLVTDMRTLRTVIQPWNRLGRFLLEVYRLESIPSQATFILAQIAAVLAIIQFVRGQGGEPQYPSIDPFQVPRPPG